MPDNIEFSGDKAAFVTLREPAWHGLGTVLDEEVDTKGMLDAGYLSNWNVRVEPVHVPDGYRAAKDEFWTIRDNPFDGGIDILGTVGSRYNAVQNEELFAFGDALLDGGRWETAGSIRNGTQVFGALALNRPTAIDDQIDNYLLVSTSHDGTMAVQASVTPIRVVCANTLAIALSGAKQTFKIRHTQSVAGKVQAAREALAIADTYLDEWDAQMAILLDTEFDNLMFEELVDGIYKPSDNASKAALTRFDKRKDVLWDIWQGDSVGDVFGTAYGAYNALNEELMWNRIGRGANADTNLAASRSGFNPVWNAENKSLFTAVQTFVTQNEQVAV